MANLTKSLADDEIRVLEYDAALSQSSNILACRTIIINLSEVDSYNRSYAALSYVWGDPAVTQPIICDGVTISVTSNLWNALSAIWKSQSSTRLWADAVSINQNNLTERSHQVSLMGDIYQSASTVFVSLGPSLRGGNRLWALFQSFQLTGSLENEEFEDELDEFMDGEPNELTMGLEDLIRRPWFQRAWTYQEIHLATTAVAICGESFIPWNSFVESLNALNHLIHFLPRFGPLQTFLEEQEFIFRKPSVLEATELNANSKAHINLEQEMSRQPLLKLLVDAWSRDASDARDKIHAFTSPKLTSTPYLELRADYSLDMRQTFIRFVRVCINNEYNLNFLRFARGIGKPVPWLEADLLDLPGLRRWRQIPNLIREPPAEALPSWVCDWRLQGMQKQEVVSGLMSSEDFSIRMNVSLQRQSIHDFSSRLVFKGLALARVSDKHTILGDFSPLPACALAKALVDTSCSIHGKTTSNAQQPLLFRDVVGYRNPPSSNLGLLLLHTMLHDHGSCNSEKCCPGPEEQSNLIAYVANRRYPRSYVSQLDWLFILDGFDELVILRPHLKPSVEGTVRSEVGFAFVSICPLRISTERGKWLDTHCAYGEGVMF